MKHFHLKTKALFTKRIITMTNFCLKNHGVHTTTVTRTVMNKIVGTTFRTIIWMLETQAAIKIHLNLQDHQLFWFWAIFLQNNLARVLIKLVSNCNLPLLCEFTAGIYQTFFGWSVLMTLSFSNILIERLCNVYDLSSFCLCWCPLWQFPE